MESHSLPVQGALASRPQEAQQPSAQGLFFLWVFSSWISGPSCPMTPVLSIKVTGRWLSGLAPALWMDWLPFIPCPHTPPFSEAQEETFSSQLLAVWAGSCNPCSGFWVHLEWLCLSLPSLVHVLCLRRWPTAMFSFATFEIILI